MCTFPKKTLLAFASVLLCSAPAQALSSLTILADNSASIAVSKLARDYARQQNISVTTSYTDRREQVLQIQEGAAADVLITSDARWIEDLQTQGLIDIYSKMEFGRGRMALVGPASSDITLKLTNNFMAAPLVHAMNSEPLLLIGNPEYVPEGKFARESLRSVGALDVLEPYTLYLKSMDEMIEQVTTRGAFTVMLYAQALLLEDAKVVDVFSESGHSPIMYYAVVVAGDNMEAARHFMVFLASTPARNIIRNSGML